MIPGGSGPSPENLISAFKPADGSVDDHVTNTSPLVFAAIDAFSHARFRMHRKILSDRISRGVEFIEFRRWAVAILYRMYLPE